MTLAELLERRDDLYAEMRRALPTKAGTQWMSDRAKELAHLNRQLARQAGYCNLCGADDAVRIRKEVWTCDFCGREYSSADVRIMADNRERLRAFANATGCR